MRLARAIFVSVLLAGVSGSANTRRGLESASASNLLLSHSVPAHARDARVFVSPYYSAPFSVSQLWFRTGPSTVGAASIEAIDAQGFAVVASVHQTLVANDWNVVTFSPPLTFAQSAYFHFDPDDGSVLELLGVTTTFWNRREGSTDSADHREFVIDEQTYPSAPPDAGALPPEYYFVPALVMVRSDKSDPWATSCPGAQQALSVGNPYFDVADVPVTSELSQSFFVPRTGAGTKISLRDFDLGMWRQDAGTPLTLTVTGGGSPRQFTGFPAQLSSYPSNFCALGLDWTQTQQLNVATVSAAHAGYSWRLLNAGDGLDACHPVARATWSGSQGAATVNGVKDPGKDFALVYVDFPVGTNAYFDRDGDHYGDPSAPDDCGYSPTIGPNQPPDCDDSRSDVHPGASEVCDGVDNDCDGKVDGQQILIAPCERSKGICAGARHRTSQCVNGSWLACGTENYGADFEESETRVCDGRDNDCDGEVDEAAACPLQQGVCSGSTATACGADGHASCDSAEYGPQYEHRESLCDGLDNDCDGLTDSADPDLIRPHCRLTLGVCADAVMPPGACDGTSWGECSASDYGPAYQQEETACDGLDNDCDGNIDEQCGRCAIAPGTMLPLSLLAAAVLLRRRARKADSPL